MNSITNYQKPEDFLNPFEIMREEIDKYLIAAEKYDRSWFDSQPLRSKVYSYVEQKHNMHGPNTVLKVASAILDVCVYTAPIIVTLIAPMESYDKKSDTLLKVCILKLDQVQNSPDVHIGIDSFIQILERPVEPGQGFAVVCNLYQGVHAFVIEKRSNESCFLYQSNLCRKGAFTFDEFLEDEKKHIEYTPKKLIKSLTKITSKDVPMLKRAKNYRKLFFTITGFKKKDEQNTCPLMFIESDPYQLKVLR